ncbi:MAG: class I SAM-dependent methyltransferase [Bacteroidia bacterium]|jgi:23S rRNA (cytosine1962-C5)-methyltransferase
MGGKAGAVIEARCPNGWSEYTLIDCGGKEKLERMGNQILIRPEPQALWTPRLAVEEWTKYAHWRFVQQGAHGGRWIPLKGKDSKTEWQLNYQSDALHLRFRLALTSFKHVGIFPEQADNWEFVARSIRALKKPAKVLNLFAYTGGASLAARQAGADVVHLDSVRQVVDWAHQNMKLSRLDGIRWILEDARKFVARERKRGHRYSGVLLDPPAYGLGPAGERWKLEDQIHTLMDDVRALLEPDAHFLLVNAYSLGLSSLVLRNFLSDAYPNDSLHTGELYLPTPESGIFLPLGVFARAWTGMAP